ncbi:hypothetical protein DRE_04161 [Drechslerella stenobrocha 248]|uniref:Uncharacterized protein n=1 Tax=Drechslerella stenobrocha 248 TaxID=1043628 RepID=W7HTH3_9PEZI|nr:hypothetical protein DRE_04161 [Drechslerella stenobrocha 248]
MADHELPISTRSVRKDLKAKPSKTISINSFVSQQPRKRESPLVEDIRAVSSYNWVCKEAEHGAPTIRVPGAPPLLIFPDADEIQLEPDSGHHFIDQNAARMASRSGLIPALAACHAYRSEFRIQDYDLITDRNNLIKLFELLKSTEPRAKATTAGYSARGSQQGRGRWRGNGTRGGRNFPPSPGRAPLKSKFGAIVAGESRVDIDVVSSYDQTTGEYGYDESSPSKTVILTRWEPNNEEFVVAEQDHRGYGSSFMKCTRRFLALEGGSVIERGPEEITGFHYLVEYTLLGKRILIRCHADGCDMSGQEFIRWSATQGHPAEAQGGGEGESDDEEGLEEDESETFDLLDAFKSLKVEEPKPEEPKLEEPKPEEETPLPATNSSGGDELQISNMPEIPLVILRTPTTIFPRRRLLQIKTRGSYSSLDRDKLHAQLFFSQTPQVFVAYHTRGKFTKKGAGKENVEEGMDAWAKENAGWLENLVRLIETVQEAASEPQTQSRHLNLKMKGLPCFLLLLVAATTPGFSYVLVVLHDRRADHFEAPNYLFSTSPLTEHTPGECARLDSRTSEYGDFDVMVIYNRPGETPINGLAAYLNFECGEQDHVQKVSDPAFVVSLDPSDLYGIHVVQLKKLRIEYPQGSAISVNIAEELQVGGLLDGLGNLGPPANAVYMWAANPSNMDGANLPVHLADAVEKVPDPTGTLEHLGNTNVASVYIRDLVEQFIRPEGSAEISNNAAEHTEDLMDGNLEGVINAPLLREAPFNAADGIHLADIEPVRTPARYPLLLDNPVSNRLGMEDIRAPWAEQRQQELEMPIRSPLEIDTLIEAAPNKRWRGKSGGRESEANDADIDYDLVLKDPDNRDGVVARKGVATSLEREIELGDEGFRRPQSRVGHRRRPKTEQRRDDDLRVIDRATNTLMGNIPIALPSDSSAEVTIERTDTEPEVEIPVVISEPEVADFGPPALRNQLADLGMNNNLGLDLDSRVSGQRIGLPGEMEYVPWGTTSTIRRARNRRPSALQQQQQPLRMNDLVEPPSVSPVRQDRHALNRILEEGLPGGDSFADYEQFNAGSRRQGP